MLQQFILKCVQAEQVRANGLHGTQNENNSLSDWISIANEEVGEAGFDFLCSKPDLALVELVQVAAVAASAGLQIMRNEGSNPNMHFRDFDFPEPFVYATDNFTPEKWMMLIGIKLGNVAKQVNEGDLRLCVIEFAHLKSMTTSAIFMLIKHANPLKVKDFIKALEDFYKVKYE